ncbi:hypothetical protein KOW79_009564 [Hemibagrus wyckioides]|uniref:Leukemia NUP98 fusion partner 1 n=1 Tax=Hemibagrus wyckioides TaxID=337641 RepID=A0A9D3SNT4_9TELE|nr:hypothetical protein KOW79_009564 [Hemibagrus wyckioides]
MNSAARLRVFYLRRGAPARAPHTPASKLSLRLLPAIIVDNDEDDDGNFTKWMSSYWGHGDGDERAKARKRSFRRSRQSTCDRRASLPCMSQLEAIRLKHPLTPTHIQRHEDQREMRSHPHARRVSSDEYRGTKAGGAESRTSTVPELTESFKRMLRFRNHRVPALVRRLEQGARPRSRSSAAVCESRKEVPFCSEQEEYRLPRQRRSLRRQR